MMRTRTLATGLALLLGAVTGAVAGMTGRKPAPPACCDAPPPRPSAVASAPGASAPGASSPVSVSASNALAATPNTAPTPVPTASAPSPLSSAAPRPRIDLTPPATKVELVSTETRCARDIPEDCERAARALDLGQILPRDAERAHKLNRVALTLYVRQCERSRALACARLAEMHETGERVFKNPATAKALWARFQELCARKPAQAGCSPNSPG